MPVDSEPNSLPSDLAELPDGWEYQPLSELVDDQRVICYGIVQPGAHAKAGIPIVRVNNIKDGRIDTSDMLWVTEDIESKYARSRLRGGEVLLTLVGSLGESAVVSPELAGWNVARAVGVIPVKKEIGPRWVELCLRSSGIQHFIHTRATTTVQATFNLRDVAKLPVPVPPKREREAITSVLGALDDKIDLNRRMNETLETTARALFQNRFVDAVQDGLPNGWEVRSLDEIAHFLNGLALQKFPPNGDDSLPVIKIAQLRAGHTDGADRAGTNLPPQYIIEDGDVLFSWSGSLEVEIWCGGRGTLNQHLFKVTSEHFPKWFYYLWTRHHLADFRNTAANKATTMGHIQRHHLSEAKVFVPPPALLKTMDKQFAPILEKLIANLRESRTLAALRDALLPKLLSGELRVKEAEKLTEKTT
jgi:type I restriction enzyme S subunit